MPDFEVYEKKLLDTLEGDFGLGYGMACRLVIEDRGWGNDGSFAAQQQALDRLLMGAVETLWSAP
jgi:hypothetical protein